MIALDALPLDLMALLAALASTAWYLSLGMGLGMGLGSTVGAVIAIPLSLRLPGLLLPCLGALVIAMACAGAAQLLVPIRHRFTIWAVALTVGVVTGALTYARADDIDPRLQHMARCYEVPGLHVIRWLLLPTVMPGILRGQVLAMPLSMALLLGYEGFLMRRGTGGYLAAAYAQGDVIAMTMGVSAVSLLILIWVGGARLVAHLVWPP